MVAVTWTTLPPRTPPATPAVAEVKASWLDELQLFTAVYNFGIIDLLNKHDSNMPRGRKLVVGGA